MNGNLGVESILGKGSSFWFKIKLENGTPLLQPKNLKSYNEAKCIMLKSDAEKFPLLYEHFKTVIIYK